MISDVMTARALWEELNTLRQERADFDELDKVRRYFTVFALKFREWLHEALKHDLDLPRL